MVRYFITYGTSKTGAATIVGLRSLGVDPQNIVAGTRDPIANGPRIKALGAGHVVHFDFEKVESMENALVGIDRVALMHVGSAAQFPAFSRFLQVATRPGSSVRSVVSIGGAAVEGDVAKDYQDAEKLILTCSLESVVILPNWFLENWKEPLTSAGIQSGTVYGSAKDGKIAYIAVQDIGDVVSRILVDGPKEWNGQRLYLSGPESLTEQELLSIIGKTVFGRDVAYVNLEPADYKAVLLGAEVPEDFAQTLIELEETKSTGHAAKVTPLIKRITGHEATSAMTWASQWASELKASSSQ
jgi:NAD(P)H dehydrogenase (quinone)